MEPAQPMPAIVAELGGAAGVEAIIADLSARLLADESLNYLLAGLDAAQLRRHQGAMLVALHAEADGADNAAMRQAHRGLGINAAQFAAAVGHLGAALEHCRVPPLVARAVIAAVAASQHAVVGA